MITEDQLEQQRLGWFRDRSWEAVFSVRVAHDGAAPTFQSHTLATLRDTLLTKLLSGEITTSIP